jgi:hypothetical protein
VSTGAPCALYQAVLLIDGNGDVAEGTAMYTRRRCLADLANGDESGMHVMWYAQQALRLEKLQTVVFSVPSHKVRNTHIDAGCGTVSQVAADRPYVCKGLPNIARLHRLKVDLCFAPAFCFENFDDLHQVL